MEFCPCCRLMTSEELVPCSICDKLVCFTPCRSKCKECWRLVCSDEMTECSNCDMSTCIICQKMNPDMWRTRPECCFDVLPPLCKNCPEDHNTKTCDSCGQEGCCEQYMYECFCGNLYCYDCESLDYGTDRCTNCQIKY